MQPLDGLWERLSEHQVWSRQPDGVTFDQLTELVETWSTRAGGVDCVEAGRSAERRPIYRIQIGEGTRHVLLWSQMHGDETTHAGILLDLVRWLQNPTNPLAATICRNCTLHAIPILNPDGAVRGTRHNALGIDINRDARVFATPEGRLLRDLCQQIQPDFAFNLHDQDRQKAIDGNCAAVSLLAPLVDARETVTENFVAAQQVASCFRQAVGPFCERMISRYDADYMPRAFGEWMQGQGVACVLVEAGGWHGDDRAELQTIHLLGLLSALHAIATHEYPTCDIAVYQSLPRSSIHKLFDLMLADVIVVNGQGHPPFTSDLGINLAHPTPLDPNVRSPGQIAEVGDLVVTSGRRRVDGKSLICLPGRIAFDPHLTTLSWQTDERLGQLARNGITTLIGSVDLDDDQQVRALGALTHGPPPPLNVGFVAAAHNLACPLSPASRDRLLYAIAQGILGFDASAHDYDPDVTRYLHWFGVPKIDFLKLPAWDVLPVGLTQMATVSRETARQLGLVDHGTITCGMAADLLLYDAPTFPDLSPIRLDQLELRYVLIGGHVVWERGAEDEFAELRRGLGCILRRHEHQEPRGGFPGKARS